MTIVTKAKSSDEKNSVPEDLTFEDGISELEEIVHRMESGDAPLDSLVSHYRKGMSLLKHCREKIDFAELKIQEVSAHESTEGNPSNQR